MSLDEQYKNHRSKPELRAERNPKIKAKQTGDPSSQRISYLHSFSVLSRPSVNHSICGSKLARRSLNDVLASPLHSEGCSLILAIPRVDRESQIVLCGEDWVGRRRTTAMLNQVGKGVPYRQCRVPERRTETSETLVLYTRQPFTCFHLRRIATA